MDKAFFINTYEFELLVKKLVFVLPTPKNGFWGVVDPSVWKSEESEPRKRSDFGKI